MRHKFKVGLENENITTNTGLAGARSSSASLRMVGMSSKGNANSQPSIPSKIKVIFKLWADLIRV